MAARRNATSVGVSVETRDEIASESFRLSAEIGKRISIGEVIRAAVAVAKRHPRELARELTRPGEDTAS